MVPSGEHTGSSKGKKDKAQWVKGKRLKFALWIRVDESK